MMILPHSHIEVACFWLLSGEKMATCLHAIGKQLALDYRKATTIKKGRNWVCFPVAKYYEGMPPERESLFILGFTMWLMRWFDQTTLHYLMNGESHTFPVKAFSSIFWIFSCPTFLFGCGFGTIQVRKSPRGLLFFQFAFCKLVYCEKNANWWLFIWHSRVAFRL